MPHFRVDDGFDGHPKTVRAGDDALGMWVRAGAWCMRYLTDGFVPDWWVKQQPKGLTKAKRLMAAGFWLGGAEKDGEKGYQFHEWLGPGRQDSRQQIETDRRSNAARQEVARNPQLRAAIRKRDGDVCRYCATPVEWSNRRGPTGGTYDHVDPEGGSTIGNLVVCCRGCNSRKGRRTPEQAGMELLPAPGFRSGSKSGVNSGSNSGSNLAHAYTQPNPTQQSDDYSPPEESSPNVSDERGLSQPISPTASRLVATVIPDRIPAAVRTGLRIQASQLMNGDGIDADTVGETLRRWLAKPGAGAGLLPSLAADVIRERASSNGIGKSSQKALGYRQMGAELIEEIHGDRS